MIAYLIRRFRILLISATLIAVVSGACNVLVITQIGEALKVAASGELDQYLPWRFGFYAVIATASHLLSLILFDRLGQRAQADLRRLISERVMHAEYSRLETTGAPKVQAALTEHTASVVGIFTTLPMILVNTVVVMGCLAYLAWLSWSIFLVAITMTALGSTGYHLAHVKAIKHMTAASKEQDQLFGHFRSIIEGAKEMRLHAAKRHYFSKYVLGSSVEMIRQKNTKGMSIFLLSSAWGQLLIYIFIGLVLFALVTDIPDKVQVMTGFALVFVYMVSPLEGLLLALPRLKVAKVAETRIHEITQQLKVSEDRSYTDATPHLESLSVRGVCHSYYHEGLGDLFKLGPIDLVFYPGQITYLVGGNGSGKTTLAKLLVGLYLPEQGDIFLNHHPISNANRNSYRQMFSAIFSDFYLFEHLLETPSADLDAQGNALLAKLNLQHKVQIRQGAFTTQDLSQGQRKRLALVVAYLENRPFLVFDEWAADQDPAFKEVFYRELLPELKARNKAVLVISHDDRYFHLADRLIRMENGRVSTVEFPRKSSELSASERKWVPLQ